MMKKQITRISPVQTSKVVAILYFVISLPIVLIMMVAMSFAPGPKGGAGLMLLAMPFMYLVFGFIFTIIAAAIYNLVAGWVGGIEFNTEETDDS
jgi:hypothetical protein